VATTRGAREDFDKRTKDTLAKRVGFRCSNPDCRKLTSGPRKDEKKSVSVGVAAHIWAAAPGGPRPNSKMTPEERSSIENGIWLCQNCGKLVDNDEQRYTAVLLRDWKNRAEAEALREVQGKEKYSLLDGMEARPRKITSAVRLHPSISLSEPTGYTDRLMGPEPTLRTICHVTVTNLEDNLPAYDAIATLKSVTFPDGKTRPDRVDRSYLKWAGESAYQRTIFPGESCAFDAFGIGPMPAQYTQFDPTAVMDASSTVQVVVIGDSTSSPADVSACDETDLALFLHSRSDVRKRKPLIGPSDAHGRYELTYAVHARDFLALEFMIVLTWKGDREPDQQIVFPKNEERSGS